ncbi:MAG TPA: XRE family transcriptional regulator [Lachnospiraceae bacterium]|nr:XRE family transcriptional regulator [Lachnospiraceae bacterium]
MILADKIILERKKNGWSQEELADKLKVTRQAVSKWEGAQSTPDLQRLLEMSRLFEVSVDYLIKDEIETEEHLPGTSKPDTAIRRISLNEASQFLQIKKETAPKIASGVTLCILSPICLFLLAGLAEFHRVSLSEDMAGGLGMMVLLAIVAIACGIFISCGAKSKPFEFLEKEIIETEYGVIGMAKEKKQQYQSTYTKYNIIGTVLCLMGVIALFMGVLSEGNGMMEIIFLCLMFAIVSIGVRLFVIAGIIQSSFDKLLQEGDYSIAKKTSSSIKSSISAIYWLVATALFLALGLSSNNWKEYSLIWPVAGVLFPAVLAVVNIFEKRQI